MSSISKLPPELLQLVFEELQGQCSTGRQALARCARVSKRWHALVIPLLYRAIELRSRGAELLQANPAYLKLIKELTLVGGAFLLPEQAVTLLFGTANLEKLTILGQIMQLFSAQFASAVLGLKYLRAYGLGYSDYISIMKHKDLVHFVLERAAGLQSMWMNIRCSRLDWISSTSASSPDSGCAQHPSLATVGEFTLAMRKRGLEVDTATVEDYNDLDFVEALECGGLASCRSLSLVDVDQFPSDLGIYALAVHLPLLRSVSISLQDTRPLFGDLVKFSHSIGKTTWTSRLQSFRSEFQFNMDEGRKIDMPDFLALDKFPAMQTVTLSTLIPYYLHKRQVNLPPDQDLSIFAGPVNQLRQIFEALLEFSRPNAGNRTAALNIDLFDYDTDLSAAVSLTFAGGEVAGKEEHRRGDGQGMWNWRKSLLRAGKDQALEKVLGQQREGQQ